MDYGGAFGTVISWAITGLIVGMALYKVLSMYVDGDISGAACAVIGSGLLLYAWMLIRFPSWTAKVFLVILLLILVWAFEEFARRMQVRGHRSFLDERTDRFRLAIAADSRNLAARSQLAEALYEQGRLVVAIEEQSILSELATPNTQDALRYEHRLKCFIRERDSDNRKNIVCPKCGEVNPPGRSQCASCAEDLLASSQLKKWLINGGLKKFAILWSAVMGVIAIVSMLLSFLSEIGRIAALAIFILILLIAWLVHAYKNW